MFFFNLLCNNKGSAAVSVTHKHVASAWQEFSGEISHTIRSVALMASAPGRPMICKLLPSMSSRSWPHTLEFYTGILPIYITSCLLPTITSFAQDAQDAQVCAKNIVRFYNLHNILIICILSQTYRLKRQDAQCCANAQTAQNSVGGSATTTYSSRQAQQDGAGLRMHDSTPSGQLWHEKVR